MQYKPLKNSEHQPNDLCFAGLTRESLVFSSYPETTGSNSKPTTNHPITDKDGDGLDGPVPSTILDYSARHDLWLWSWPSLEAQCAAIADDIAYDNHDLDDALRAGLISLDDLADLPICGAVLREISEEHPNLPSSRIGHELVRRQITAMVEDVITEASARIDSAKPETSDDVRNLDYALVAFSPAMEANEKVLKAFLFEKVYRSKSVMQPVRSAERIVADLFDRFMDDERAMPDHEDWSVTGLQPAERATVVCDYIAGMTDRYAVSEHRRLFDRTPDLG